MNASTLKIAANGRLVIPATMRAELGLEKGGVVIARLVDGSVVLEPIGSAISRAQAMVRRYVPEGSALVDELIAERRAESTRE